MDETCTDLLRFLQESPTPYHAVESALRRLTAVGFSRLDEATSWRGLAPGRYAVIRGGSLLAFVLPPGPARAFRIAGAHTDSPNLRLKSRPEYAKMGYHQIGVEVYGGVILNSWLDRDLGLAGRIVVRQNGELETRLLQVDRPIARIPQLAIHLDREVNDRGLVLHRQEHLPPVLGLTGEDAPSALRSLCARELGVTPDDLLSFDLMLYDLTPPVVGGLSGEFLFSARLDNLAMCHASLGALIAAAEQVREGVPIPVVALFDHEEVGSSSATGAGAPLLPMLLERLVLATGGDRDDYHASLARSLCVSADMAHAVHPNYPERHETRHRPALNAGPVVKLNAQQRYATCGRMASLFDELCRRRGIKAQYYVHRTDLPCGSTIGPITATLLGIPTVDVGSPMLSMHSIREMAGTADPRLMTSALTAFLEHTGGLLPTTVQCDDRSLLGSRRRCPSSSTSWVGRLPREAHRPTIL
ncbi:MAG: M18 family aminopeptidase [Myxococcales bacterium]|nr:M18 family aminopeptidase [Polyangiaceae bacterium]MDW8249063.1 M18 family aminopeptidase [Myxococcales bacterium]